MRRRKTVVIVSVCSVAVVLSLLFLYVSEFPFFPQPGVMTVGQLNTGINYWRNFYVGRNVTVKGTLEHFTAPAVPLAGLHGLENLREFPFNGLLVDDNLNGTGAIPINLNWTQYSSLLGTDVIAKGEILDEGHFVYIQAENVMSALMNALINAF